MHLNHLGLCDVWILSLILLIASCSFADDRSAIDYPDRIKCIVDTYLVNFPEVEKYLGDVNNSYLWRNYISSCGHYLGGKEALKDYSLVISINEFKVKSKKDFRLEIWIMKASVDADMLLALLSDCCEKDVSFIDKPPKRFFVYKNFFVLIMADTFNARDMVNTKADEIIEKCIKQK
jgi:hypothetical protein